MENVLEVLEGQPGDDEGQLEIEDNPGFLLCLTEEGHLSQGRDGCLEAVAPALGTPPAAAAVTPWA